MLMLKAMKNGTQIKQIKLKVVGTTHYFIINITNPLHVMSITVSNGKLLGKFRYVNSFHRTALPREK